MTSAARALASLSRILGQLSVPWVVVGSMATSLHGRIRTTQDIDVVVLIPPARLQHVAAALAQDFFVDPELLRDNFAAGRSAKIFYRPEHFKVDLFPLTGDPLQQAQLSRAAVEQIELGGESISIPVSTAEDTLLAKLRWWRESGQSSRHWEDMLGIVAASGPQLDREYLTSWAIKLNLPEDLTRLLASSLPPPGAL